MAVTAHWTVATLVSVSPQSLPSTLDPPPYRFRVAYQHNYTVQNSGFLGAATDAQKQFVAKPDQYASRSSNAVLQAYRRPNDSQPVGGALLVQADAQAVADDLAALWSTRRRLYLAEVPIDVGLQAEFGDVVMISYPLEGLANGQTGQIVGELFRAGDATTKLLVLI